MSEILEQYVIDGNLNAITNQFPFDIYNTVLFAYLHEKKEILDYCLKLGICRPHCFWRCVAEGIKRDRMDLFDFALEHGYVPNGCELILACTYEKLDFVNKLLALGTNVDVNHQSEDGDYPVTVCATYNKSPNVLRTLIAYDANVNVRNWQGQTLLILAIIDGSDEMVNYLIPISDVNAIDNKGNTALIHAIKQREVAVFGALLDAKADINIMNNKGKTPLDYWWKISEEF